MDRSDHKDIQKGCNVTNAECDLINEAQLKQSLERIVEYLKEKKAKKPCLRINGYGKCLLTMEGTYAEWLSIDEFAKRLVSG